MAFLKDFVSNLCIVKRLVYEAMPFGAPVYHVVPAALVAYVVQWEPETNGFFLGECLPGVDPVEGETLRVRRACGHHGDVCWTYDSYYGQGLRFYARTAQSVTGERTNDVVGACLGALDYLSQVLNKGIPNRDIGAIRWSGDRCVRTNALGIVWSGTLLVE